ncbi:MAG: AzlD domain-containing protein [Lachnospiraceae bacterium]|nr:AzlD domain-containing protein [Lachnospiraceae bacterium]
MILLLILTASAVTILLRAFPFVLFGGKRQMPSVIHRIADLMPPAIIAVLVVYCLKGSIAAVTMESLAAAVAAAATALVHIWKRNTLASIAVGTLVYMVLIRVLL